MSLPDPQIVTINSVDKTLNRIEPGPNYSLYATSDRSYGMKVSHQATKAKRIRSLLRVDYRKVVTDPLTSESDYDTCSISIVIDRPEYGFTDTEIVNLADGATAKLGYIDTDLLAGQH